MQAFIPTETPNRICAVNGAILHHLTRKRWLAMRAFYVLSLHPLTLTKCDLLTAMPAPEITITFNHYKALYLKTPGMLWKDGAPVGQKGRGTGALDHTRNVNQTYGRMTGAQPLVDGYLPLATGTSSWAQHFNFLFHGVDEVPSSPYVPHTVPEDVGVSPDDWDMAAYYVCLVKAGGGLHSELFPKPEIERRRRAVDDRVLPGSEMDIAMDKALRSAPRAITRWSEYVRAHPYVVSYVLPTLASKSKKRFPTRRRAARERDAGYNATSRKETVSPNVKQKKAAGEIIAWLIREFRAERDVCADLDYINTKLRTYGVKGSVLDKWEAS